MKEFRRITDLDLFNGVHNSDARYAAAYAGYCTLWEDILAIILPPGGLKDWGASLFVELTRNSPAPELDPRTTAKRECIRLAHEIVQLTRAMSELSDGASRLDYKLSQRSYKLSRTADLMSNIVDELLLLHDSGLEGLVETEQEHMLNYQIFCF